MTNLVKPELILFDAAGTLFEVRGSVGDIYCRVAARYGLQADTAHIQQRFAQQFGQQPPLAFPTAQTETALQRLEYDWWRTLVWQVFAGQDFPRFDEFFAEVFAYFRQPDAWRVFADVKPTLTALRAQGYRLAVLSNFDSRLDGLLQDLGLTLFFDAVHISSRLGAAKPAPAAFHAALATHNLAPHQVIHIGDSPREDFTGAQAAGLRAFLIDRQRIGVNHDNRLSSLTQLIDRLIAREA